MSEEQNLKVAEQTKWFDNFIPKAFFYMIYNLIEAEDLEKQIAISPKQYWYYIINIILQYQQIQIEMFNAIISKLQENSKLIVDDNNPDINKLAEFKINKNMFPKNCVIAISDTHGDIAAIIGVFISIGMFSFTGNFVWFDLETNEIIYDPSKIDVKLYNRYVLLPELVPNKNCDITFLHLGDYIDRGWESIQSLALLKYINEIKGNLEIHFLAGNHEISYNDGIMRLNNN